MNADNKPIQFYRYEAIEYGDMLNDDKSKMLIPSVKLVLQTYKLTKETPKGYWINYGFTYGEHLRIHSRWVSKTARKRFAYPTKQEALDNYIARTNRRISILKGQLRFSQLALTKAYNLNNNHGTPNR